MTMNLTAHETYLNWLESLVRTPKRDSFRDCLELMFMKEYDGLVPNDDNRIADGLDVRTEWLVSNVDRYAVGDGPCSFLEVLVGLSRRMSFMADQPAEGWAWQLLVNLGLEGMRDPLPRSKAVMIDDIMEAVIWRTYSPDGSGGFFPLTHPRDDQRKVELWYQMSAYIEEIHPEF